MAKEHLWDKSRGYNLGRAYVDWCTRSSFKSLTVQGRENIPQDGVILFASNHCNTLMDALVVLQARKEPTSFGARADIFNQPVLGAIFRWMYMVPLARHNRDGKESAVRNEETFKDVVDCLDHGIPFCIMVEGTHRPKRSLLPVRKGIFRIAGMAKEMLGKKVWIVPVGLEYGDYFHYMDTVVMSYGKPIEYTGEESLESMSETLYNAIASLITFFPDDDNYDAAEAEWEKSREPVFKPVHWVLAVLALGFFVAAGLLCSPILAATWFFRSKLKDKTWRNTVRFGCKMVLLPLMVIAAAIVGFIKLPWYGAIALIAAVILSHQIFYLILNFYRKLLKKI